MIVYKLILKALLIWGCPRRLLSTGAGKKFLLLPLLYHLGKHW